MTAGLAYEDVAFDDIQLNLAWQESSAALRIARHLPGAWKLLRVFAAVPRPLRDAVYRRIARDRV